MASPLPTRKQAVDLAAPPLRVSRIRRDPPPPVKVVTAAEIKEKDAQVMLVGIIAFALAMFVVLVGFSKGSGWSPSHYTIRIEDKE